MPCETLFLNTGQVKSICLLFLKECVLKTYIKYLNYRKSINFIDYIIVIFNIFNSQLDKQSTRRLSYRKNHASHTDTKIKTISCLKNRKKNYELYSIPPLSKFEC